MKNRLLLSLIGFVILSGLIVVFVPEGQEREVETISSKWSGVNGSGLQMRVAGRRCRGWRHGYMDCGSDAESVSASTTFWACFGVRSDSLAANCQGSGAMRKDPQSTEFVS